MSDMLNLSVQQLISIPQCLSAVLLLISLNNILAMDTMNGEKVGFKKAEVFKLIRMLK